MASILPTFHHGDKPMHRQCSLIIINNNKQFNNYCCLIREKASSPMVAVAVSVVEFISCLRIKYTNIHIVIIYCTYTYVCCHMISVLLSFGGCSSLIELLISAIYSTVYNSTRHDTMNQTVQVLKIQSDF